MERSSGRALDAMWGPWTTTLFEADVTRRMPVTRHINRDVVTLRFFDPTIENRHYLIATRHRKRSARTKVVLYVNDQECIALPHVSILNLVITRQTSKSRKIGDKGAAPTGF